MTVSGDRLRRIVASIWSTQLGLELEHSEIESVGGLLEVDAVSCVVMLSGEFNGMLVQRCSRALSMVAAAAAFATSGGDLGATDVRDTVSEIAHVTAGNLRSILPGRTVASRPETFEDAEDAGETVAEVGFTLDGEPLAVTLIRSTLER